jgi:hypothetical protein
MIFTDLLTPLHALNTWPEAYNAQLLSIRGDFQGYQITQVRADVAKKSDFSLCGNL